MSESILVGPVQTQHDAQWGDPLISEPDLTVLSLGRANGQPTGNSEFGPIFFAEAEHGNRSLPELIRHLGMLLVNFPNLNGVLGIKGEEDGNGNKVNALILIERERQVGLQVSHTTRIHSSSRKGSSLWRRLERMALLELMILVRC